MSEVINPQNQELDKKGCAKGCGCLILLALIFMISGKVIDGVGDLLSGSSENEVRSTMPETTDGIYNYSDYFMEVSMRISGSRWSATIRYKSGNDTEYESGSVSGSDLYDSSGLFKIGHIAGNRIQTTFGEKRITLYR